MRKILAIVLICFSIFGMERPSEIVSLYGSSLFDSGFSTTSHPTAHDQFDWPKRLSRLSNHQRREFINRLTTRIMHSAQGKDTTFGLSMFIMDALDAEEDEPTTSRPHAKKLTALRLIQYMDRITHTAFNHSKDTIILVQPAHDNRVYLYDTQTGRCIRDFDHGHFMFGMMPNAVY